MNTFLRWVKFNLVGAMGMAVQLSALGMFTRLMRGHYLFAAAAAVELALLHNFFWHWHYTWRERAEHDKPLRPLVRFHLANGLVSLLGNISLMWLLVEKAHWTVFASNGAAILCCLLANFFLSDTWAFESRPLHNYDNPTPPPIRPNKCR